jgi:tryptophan synthase alpha chain
MNRIQERFRQLQNSHQKGLITYIGAGDPHLDATCDLALAFDKAGVDVLELGVPFSDPLADGLTNQLAAQRGLDSGTTPAGVLNLVAQIRRSSAIPIVLYLYYNLAVRNGLDEFIHEASKAGVDGMLMLDLPPEEGAQYRDLMSQAGLCAIHLVAPTTPEDRIRYIVSHGRGFIYYVSREGVTGVQQSVSETIGERVDLIRRHTDLPIAVGFGISTPAQATAVASQADAVVVGSAIVNQIARCGQSPDLVTEVTAFVQTLVEAVKNPGGRLASSSPPQR